MAKKSSNKSSTKQKTPTKKKAPAAKQATKKAGPKNPLVANINRRKRLGISRSKDDSTISGLAYQQMHDGWPNSKKAKATRKKKHAKKKA